MLERLPVGIARRLEPTRTMMLGRLPQCCHCWISTHSQLYLRRRTRIVIAAATLTAVK
jgi:hypothetical protein